MIRNWKEVTKELPYGNYLVTNNINARLNDGQMSHIWHTHMVHEERNQTYGPFTAFYGNHDARVWRVCGVTHYIDLSPFTLETTDTKHEKENDCE